MHVPGSIMLVVRKFICSRCGACCRCIGLNPEARELGMCNSDGSCIYLDKDTNLCTIYENRPLICRVDDLYDTGCFKDLSRSDYYNLNYESCKKLQEILEMNLD